MRIFSNSILNSEYDWACTCSVEYASHMDSTQFAAISDLRFKKVTGHIWLLQKALSNKDILWPHSHVTNPENIEMTFIQEKYPAINKKKCLHTKKPPRHIQTWPQNSKQISSPSLANRFSGYNSAVGLWSMPPNSATMMAEINRVRPS